ncbi:MAG: saccharopine dehydrogenase NADP-binding domain-containing protein [Chitinophagales bacterium]
MQQQMIYGATGYMGKLITRKLVEEGLKPILAGRSERVEQFARAYGLDHRIFALDQQEVVNENLKGISLLINLAGPFNLTNRPLVIACLANKAHYIDISGESTVFQTVFSFHEKAKEAGIMLMPGTGFGIVPTDVMALILKQEMPDGDKLVLGFAIEGRASQGTMRVGIKSIHQPGVEIVNGKQQAAKPAAKSFQTTIANKKMTMVQNPWRGDLFTAPITTGIQNIVTYTAFPKLLVTVMRHPSLFGGVMKSKFMDWLISRMPEGPDEKELKNGKSYVYGKISNSAGEQLEKVMTGPEAYLYTAITTIHIAKNILKGDFKFGFQTPAGLYGKELITGIEGVRFL